MLGASLNNHVIKMKAYILLIPWVQNHGTPIEGLNAASFISCPEDGSRNSAGVQ
jgi:hypothetical protein